NASGVRAPWSHHGPLAGATPLVGSRAGRRSPRDAARPRGAGHQASRRNVTSARDRAILPALLSVAALMLFTWRLWEPPAYVFDEVYHAYTAGQYVAGNKDAYLWNTTAPRHDVAYMWNHPPLGVLLIAAGILAYGDQPFGWRIASAMFGAIGVGIAFLLTLAL